MQRMPILIACAATIAALGGAGIAMNQPKSAGPAVMSATRDAIANSHSSEMSGAVSSSAETAQSSEVITPPRSAERVSAEKASVDASLDASLRAQPVAGRGGALDAVEQGTNEQDINDAKGIDSEENEAIAFPPVIRRLALKAQAEPAQPYLPKTVAIRDEVTPGSSFARFRTRLRQAVRDRDADFLQQIADENISLSFGRGVTLEQRLAEPNAAFWNELERAIGGDCAVDGYAQASPIAPGLSDPGYFACPASFAVDAFHPSIDPYMMVYVDGTDVAVRQLPSQNSPVLMRVSNSILQFSPLPWDEAVTEAENVQLNNWYQASETQSGWKFVSLPDGRKGFISSRYAYSALGYRAMFHQDGPEHWTMTVFIAGD